MADALAPEFQPSPIPPDLAELGEIIRAYSEAAAELQRSHQMLQAQVAQLAGELQNKNAELSQTVTQVSSLKNYLASIIESSADGIVAIGLDRRVMAWNAAAGLLGDFLGSGIEKPEGGFILDIMGETCREMGILLMRALNENARFSNVEIRLPDLKGRRRILSVSASPVRSSPADGKKAETIGAVETFRDLTDLKELEERAQRQDRLAALGEMAAGVAHEIRNPLGGIELYASNLGRKFPPDSAENATCRKIIAAAASLNRIVTDMLTFTRNRDPQPRPATCRQVVRAALDLAAGEMRDVEVALDFPVGEKKFLLDFDLLARAFLNVILNAAQAMHGKGRLSVTCASVKDDIGNERLEFVFADDGPGIPEEVRDRIFNPFFTLRRDGTGLGLAIVHKIVHDHGGEVKVESNQPHGALFRFSFPAHEA